MKPGAGSDAGCSQIPEKMLRIQGGASDRQIMLKMWHFFQSPELLLTGRARAVIRTGWMVAWAFSGHTASTGERTSPNTPAGDAGPQNQTGQ